MKKKSTFIQSKLGNDRLQYFNKFGFGSVTVSKILRGSVTVRLRFCSKSQTSVTVRFRFTSRNKTAVSVAVSVSEKSRFLVRFGFGYLP